MSFQPLPCVFSDVSWWTFPYVVISLHTLVCPAHTKPKYPLPPVSSNLQIFSKQSLFDYFLYCYFCCQRHADKVGKTIRDLIEVIHECAHTFKRNQVNWREQGCESCSVIVAFNKTSDINYSVDAFKFKSGMPFLTVWSIRS